MGSGWPAGAHPFISRYTGFGATHARIFTWCSPGSGGGTGGWWIIRASGGGGFEGSRGWAWPTGGGSEAGEDQRGNGAVAGGGAAGRKDMGKVIGAVLAQVKGRAEGSTVSRLVKQALGA